MAHVIDESISEADFCVNHSHYLTLHSPNENERFRYGICLIKCVDKERVKNAIELFQELYGSTADEQLKRDSLYYMAIGETKLHNYEKALTHLNEIIQSRQNSAQINELYDEIKRRHKKDSLIGLGVAVGAGGAVLITTGLYGFIKVAGAMVRLLR